MKLMVSFRDLENHKSVEKEMEHSVKKLAVLLQSYSPDLVQLHAVFSKVSRTGDHELLFIAKDAADLDAAIAHAALQQDLAR